MNNGLFISQVCKKLNLEYIGKDVQIDGLNLVGRESSKTSILSYVTSTKYKKKIEKESAIRVLVVSPKIVDNYKAILLDRGGGVIFSDEPEKTFYLIHRYLINQQDFYIPIVPDTSISDTAIIHPTAIVEDNVVIEKHVQIGAFSLIKSGSIIRHDSVIGNHTTIGAEGYQVLRFDGVPYKIKHFGGVLIDENVEIGDHCTVCNTIFDGFTRIGMQSKIDNYCQIAHYCNIGKNVIITPGVTIVGSVTIEDNCYIGAGATLMNKVTVHQGAIVGIGAVVIGNVKAGTTVMGNPAKQIF